MLCFHLKAGSYLGGSNMTSSITELKCIGIRVVHSEGKLCLFELF